MGQKRRQFLIATGALLAAQLARAQQPQRLRRIGLLGVNHPDHPGAKQLRMGITKALGKLGYREGENLAIDLRYADGILERLPALAAELVRLKVEAIVSPVNATTRALQRATRSIPIVMVSSLPVENGFIETHARPGGNITGLDTWPTTELVAKGYQILKQAVPQAKVVASLRNPRDPQSRLYDDEFRRRVAATSGLAVVPIDLVSADGLPQALHAVVTSRADALFVGGGEVTNPVLAEIAAFAAKHRLVAIGSSPIYVSVGGLLYYGADIAAIWERTASYVDRILRGAKPRELAVEQPTKYELVLNVKTVKAMDLKLPPSFMAQVDRVIE
jgi:putative tryptophan/tyrosine transport system substrate-binding protein